MSWWRNDDALRRVVCDLVAAELRRLRVGQALRPEPPWPDDLAIGEEGLGADSLELIALSSALVEALGLARSGLADLLLARRTIGGWIDTCRVSLGHVDDTVVFRSSGSTGASKACAHALAALEQEARTLAELLPGRRVLAAVPAHHIYGFLFTVLLPQQLGVDVVALERSGPGGLGTCLEPGDLVIAHPAYWSGVGRAGLCVPPDVTAVTSTAPCPPELFAALPAVGFRRLVEIYGSSETAGVGWRAAAGTFELFPHLSRAAVDDGLVRFAPSGASALVLQDRLAWRSERHFDVIGRLDGAVNVGGVKVFPQHVREVLRRHPLVADAEVRLMQPGEGERLKAFIVPHEQADSPEARDALAQWIERQLSVAERPRALTFGPAVPIGPLGKRSDWEVAGDAI